MVLAYRRLRPMVQVCTATVLAMECLTAVGSIRGFAEALALVLAGALAEVSVGAGAEVAAGADLVIGGRFELASNCRKDRYYAKR